MAKEKEEEKTELEKLLLEEGKYEKA